MPILLATTNPGKLREIRLILAGLPHAFVALGDLPGVAEPEETGVTFAENARQKARYYANACGFPTVAEDSGLEIDALDGAPGLYSSRYHGATYPEKFANIYAALRARGADGSPARFVCCLALASGAEIVFEARGTVEGLVSPEPRGTHGFGYDPIFLHPPSGRTLGELEDDEKRAVSHRGEAFRALRAYLSGHPPAEFERPEPVEG
jgi:XTP/dITP diphosphohydrolase